MKTNQVSLREEFVSEFPPMPTKSMSKYPCGTTDEIFSWWISKLAQILEGLPCEENKTARFDWRTGWNDHVKETKQYRDKWLGKLR